LNRGIFKNNVTGGDIRLKGNGRRVTSGTLGSRSPPITMQYVYLPIVEHQTQTLVVH